MMTPQSKLLDVFSIVGSHIESAIYRSRPPSESVMSDKNLTQDMKPFELLYQAIPRGESDEIGRLIGLSGQTVRSWRNDPETDDQRPEDPHGRRSPLDLILQFLVAVHARSPKGARMIRDFINNEFAQMEAIHGHDQMLAAVQAAGEARELAQRIIELTDKMRIGDK